MSDIVQIVVTETPVQVVATNFIPIATAATASVAVSASYADVASLSNTATSASFATTASYAANVPVTASFANNATSASFAQNALSASYASNVPETSSYAVSASHALNSDNAISASNVLYNNIGQKPTLFSGSSQVQLNQITGTTFANADFTFPANVNVLGTATVRQLYTQYETSSIIFASGSTKFGDTADDTHQFTGSVSILGTATSVEGFTGSLQGNANTATTASYAQTYAPVTTIYEEIVAGENLVKGDPLYISGSSGAKPIVYKANASDANKMPVVFIALENTNQGNDTLGIVLGLISGINLTGYNVGDVVYVGAGGGWTATRPTGSAIVQVLGIITKAGNGGKALVLNPGPVEIPNLAQGNVWVGDANALPQAVTTSSLVNGKNILPASVTATGVLSGSNIVITNSGSIAGIDISTGLINNNITNMGIGPGALLKLPSGSNITGSIAIGFNAFGNISSSTATTTANNVIIGFNAYASASTVQGNTGARNNVAVGAGSMISSSTVGSVAVGSNTLARSTGQQNTAVGLNALRNLNIGALNIAVGSFAGDLLQSGSSNIFLHSAGTNITSGSFNVMVGPGAATALRTGSNNVVIGLDALDTIVEGNNNIALGSHAGRRVTSGSNELFINSIDRTNAAGDYSSSIIYGRQSEVASGQVLRLNAQVIAPHGITGSITSASFATTASFVGGVIASASYASTASIAENVSGFISFPNGLFVTGSVSASVFSGSGAGLTNVSAVTATSASFATTASAATSITFTPATASFATTASAATSITFIPTSASFATTASFATNAGVVFPFSGSAIITGSLNVSGSGNASASVTPVNLNGIMWSGSYGSSSIIPSVVSASDLGSPTNPFRNAYFTGFISASAFASFSAAPPPPGVTSASFTYDASSATPVTGATGSVAGIHDQIKACIVSSSGERLYYLNSTNWSQREDTTPSTLNAAGQHVMIEIPKMYWTASQAGTGATRTVTYRISMDAASTGSGFNFQLHPAFYKSGSVVDYRYVSAYLATGRSGSTIVTGNGAMDTGSAANQLASISGSAPLNTRSKTSYRQLANNIGNGWGIHEIYLQNAIELLYLTEYKDLNTQAELGNGNGSTSAVAGGSNAYANGSTPTGYVGSIRYRGIENLWGVASQWVDGIVLSPTPITAYVTNDHRYFADYPSSTTLANYTRISGSMNTFAGGGYLGDYYEYNSHQLPLIIPTATGGSSTTKFCDFGYHVSFTPSGSYSIGGNGSTAGQIGLWYREVEVPTRSDAFYATRITY